jgi:hypothetical protein
MNRPGRWLVVTAPLLLALVLVAQEGQARPSGGNSYSGSSSSSSSSSGGSSRSGGSSSGYSSRSKSNLDLGTIGLILGLAFAAIVIAGLATRSKTPPPPNWNTPKQREENKRLGLVPKELDRLRVVGPPGPDGRPVPFDPDFSRALFEDFLHALYARVHSVRGGGRLDTMSAYLSTRTRYVLGLLGQPAQVHEVGVKALQYISVSPLTPDSDQLYVVMRFDAHYTEVSASGAEQHYDVAEEWVLTRLTKVKSRSPENVRVFKCPNCGGPLDDMRGRTCPSCQKKVNTGEFDWVVCDVTMQQRKSR